MVRYHVFQSAYSATRSTETAIARVLSDLLSAQSAVDSGDIAVLVILLQRLERLYGIHDISLNWFRS